MSYPEIYEMQVEAILKAAHNLHKSEGLTITPEIMIPLVMNASELKQMKEILLHKITKLEKKLKYEF